MNTSERLIETTIEAWTFNLNNLVEFQPTPEGLKVIKDSGFQSYQDVKWKLRMPIWEFARIFGSHFSMVSELLIVENSFVILRDKTIEEIQEEVASKNITSTKVQELLN